MTLVAILTVRKTAVDKFRAFESHAAKVMKKHGGRIERTVVVAADSSAEVIREIHVITFPSAAAFSAYRSDGQLAEFTHLRDASVVHTELFAGEDGPSYAAG